MDNRVYYLFEEICQVMGTIGSMLMALIVIVGLIQCFFGFKLMRAWFAVWGFGIGFVVGAFTAGEIIVAEPGVIAISGFLGGILGAVLLYRVYIIGVFITNAVMSGLCLFMLLGAGEAAIVFAVIGAVIIGVCSCKFVRIWSILSTGFSGGMLAGNAFVPMMQMYNPGLALVLGFVISVLGVLFQWKTTGGKVKAEKKAAKKAAEAEKANAATVKTETADIAAAEKAEPVVSVAEDAVQKEEAPVEKTAVVLPQAVTEKKAVLTEKLSAKLPETEALKEKLTANLPPKEELAAKLSNARSKTDGLAEKLIAKIPEKEVLVEKIAAKIPEKEALVEKFTSKTSETDTQTEKTPSKLSKKTMLIAGGAVLVLILLLTMCGKGKSVEEIYETGYCHWGEWDDNGYTELWYTEEDGYVLILDGKIVCADESYLEQAEFVNGECWYLRVGDNREELEFINSKGETMIDLDKIVGKEDIDANYYPSFYYDHYILYNDGYWGAIDMQGNIVVPFEYMDYWEVEDIIWWNYS